MTQLLIAGKNMGELENGILRKRLDATKHFLRVPAAIAIDANVFYNYEISMIAIHEVTERKKYWAHILTFRKLGIPIDRGRGEQIALELHYWFPTEREAIAYSKTI